MLKTWHEWAPSAEILIYSSLLNSSRALLNLQSKKPQQDCMTFSCYIQLLLSATVLVSVLFFVASLPKDAH